MADWFYWQGTNLRLHLLVTPGAKQTCVMGVHDKHLKIRVAAPPEDGKANKEIIKFFAAVFQVTQREIEITKGELSRIKLISIESPKNTAFLKKYE